MQNPGTLRVVGCVSPVTLTCLLALTTLMNSEVVFFRVACRELTTPALCCFVCVFDAAASADRDFRSFTSVLRCVILCLIIAVISLISSAGSSNSDRRWATASIAHGRTGQITSLPGLETVGYGDRPFYVSA
eukprot:SAG25_NODE_939_length_4667_cov_9.559379_3_plen_132_part_00